LTTYLGTNLTSNLTDVTVQCSGFTPQLQASQVSLDVTGPGQTISGALSGVGDGGFVILAANTNNGNITLQDLPPTSTDVALGELNAGTGTIQLAVQGSVISGADLANILGFIGYSTPYAYDTSLTADAVVLTTTGSSSAIGAPADPFFGGGPFPITTSTPGGDTQPLELTVATNDGFVYIQDSSPAGLMINSVVADVGGQAATVVDGQIVVNSTPGSSTPTYISVPTDFTYVAISSTGPVVLNSVSSVGAVDITGAYILEGNAQSPTIIAPEVDLVAAGTAAYEGQVAFAQGSSGDTLTLPATGNNWNYYGFSDLMDGDSIVVSGAIASADDGAFTIKSVSGDILTLTQSFVLTTETQLVMVGDGMIGQASAAIALSDVPLFTATTNDGAIYLELGSAVDSTAANVSAGGMNGVANAASVTSEANFLTIENIDATGEAPDDQRAGPGGGGQRSGSRHRGRRLCCPVTTAHRERARQRARVPGRRQPADR
jgi:hypothetical protein